MQKKTITIQTFYPTGDTRGFRIAEITSSTIEALLIPRKELRQVLKSRVELQSSGIYFLFGKENNDNQQSTEVYIGESETLADRLKKQNKEKDFWEVAIVFISSNQRRQLNKADIKYLEHTLYFKAKLASRFYINQTIPTKSLVTEAREADLNELLNVIDTLLTSLGYPVFTKLVTESEVNLNDEEIFYTSAKGSNARGVYTNEGFVILKGSSVSPKEKNIGFNKEHVLKRLLENGIINQEGIFTEDYLFSSPSTAIAVVIKGRGNGWTYWKNRKDKTLDEVYRKTNDL